jgi:glycosyltransferase involved in cell wall biosynthesis
MSMVDREAGRVTGSTSVAICTHNGEKFIAEQLESIFAQSVLPDEIVISDDASTDKTVELARETLQRLSLNHRPAPAFTLLTNPRALGVTANFEQAIRSCSGAIIVLSDQDDRWLPDRIERTRELFATRKTLLLIHGDARLVGETGETLGTSLFGALEIGVKEIAAIHGGDAFRLLLRRNLVTGATVAIRASLATVAMPFPSAWVHDEWLAIVAAAVGELDVIEHPLIDYRQHGANQIGVRRLGPFGKFKRIREPGARRNARLLERAVELEERFILMGDAISPVKLDLVKRKLVHEQVRSSFPENRRQRVTDILRELGTGRYLEFGRGVADALRDVVQPLDDLR